MRKFGTFNKISKIYSQKEIETVFEKKIYTIEVKQFKTTKEALNYFFTPEALKIFKYCHKFKKKLVNDRYDLHWTIDFGVPADPKEKPWADCWRDIKAELTDKNIWFNNPTNVIHDAPHLF